MLLLLWKKEKSACKRIWKQAPCQTEDTVWQGAFLFDREDLFLSNKNSLMFTRCRCVLMRALFVPPFCEVKKKNDCIEKECYNSWNGKFIVYCSHQPQTLAVWGMRIWFRGKRAFLRTKIFNRPATAMAHWIAGEQQQCIRKGGRRVDKIRYDRSDRNGAFGFGNRYYPGERTGCSRNFKSHIYK